MLDKNTIDMNYARKHTTTSLIKLIETNVFLGAEKDLEILVGGHGDGATGHLGRIFVSNLFLPT